MASMAASRGLDRTYEELMQYSEIADDVEHSVPIFNQRSITSLHLEPYWTSDAASLHILLPIPPHEPKYQAKIYGFTTTVYFDMIRTRN